MAEDVFGIVGSLQAAVFRVERVVAEGGFGVVYRAHHEGFKAAVALKCLKIPGAFSAEQRQAFLQKFQEEGEVLFRLSALIPSVVRPLHVGTLETSKHPFVPFIALEWLDGESLDSVIERRRKAGKPPLDLGRVVRMMGPVARALECAHKFPGPEGAQLSILHRDLKPENLFLAKVHGQETLKILDFGIGKVRSAATQVASRPSKAASPPSRPRTERPSNGYRSVTGRLGLGPTSGALRCARSRRSPTRLRSKVTHRP
jgi:serine/threonine-protein kinase